MYSFREVSALLRKNLSKSKKKKIKIKIKEMSKNLLGTARGGVHL